LASSRILNRWLRGYHGFNQHNLLELSAKSRHTDEMKKFASTRDIIIHTGKFEEAARFYEEVLALPVTTKSGKLVGFETGSFQLFVDGRDSLRMGPVFEFSVADVEEAKQQLVANGCAVVAEDESVPRCYIKDPHGLVFNLTTR
jgi:predicted enzyme related to lactoylglutathione lyase